MKNPLLSQGVGAELTAATLTTPSGSAWFAELNRLVPYQDDLALLTIGWSSGNKGAMPQGWQHHCGFTVTELQQIRRIRSVGARTGLLTGPLLARN